MGDIITFGRPAGRLMGNRMAGKTLTTGRAWLAMSRPWGAWRAAKFAGKVVFCATVQEEIGLKGGRCPGASSPDWGIAIDVCHGDTPDAPSEDTCSLTRWLSPWAPTCIRPLTKGVLQVTERKPSRWRSRVANSPTARDANAQVADEGTPWRDQPAAALYAHHCLRPLTWTPSLSGGRLLALRGPS